MAVISFTVYLFQATLLRQAYNVLYLVLGKKFYRLNRFICDKSELTVRSLVDEIVEHQHEPSF